jgi:hypothetical protein
MLVFRVKMGEGFPLPPVTVKATQIASRIYWKQPGLTKQVIIGLRDTLFLPGNIGYYQDRYGIVQNNFPDVIRLGDGRDVGDVPHPLSAAGLGEYEFAMGDSSSVDIGERVIDVYVMAVRPRNDALPRVIGKVFIEKQSAAVVKMEFTFTRAAFLDKRNEVLTVMLENALIDGRYWLPRHQELSLTRVDAILDFPARTIISARWSVCCYAINVDVPTANFVGFPIVRSSAAVLAQHRWETTIVDALPLDVRLLTSEEERSIRMAAEQMVRTRALSRTAGGALSVRRVSDFFRVNRVEGPAVGIGTRLRSGTGVSLALTGRYGFSDREPKGSATLSIDRGGGVSSLQLFAENDYREVSAVAERSPAFNSVAAAAFGSDYTDPYRVTTFGVALDLNPLGSTRPRIEASYELHAPLAVHFEPASGSFSPVFPAARIRTVALEASLLGHSTDGLLASLLRWELRAQGGLFADRDAALSLGSDQYMRLSGELSAEHTVGGNTLIISAQAGAAFSPSNAPIAMQHFFLHGGPVSAPGYEFHELAGKFVASTRLEYHVRVPFFPISLGKYGDSPAHLTLAPYLSLSYLSGPPRGPEVVRDTGFYPSAGIGALLLFDLLRIDVARGLRGGRFIFSADIMRPFWNLL